MSVTKKQKDLKAMAKEEKVANKMRKGEGRPPKRAYGYMAVGGVALFFQALILCLNGYFWSGGFLFPLAALCWVKSMPRAFELCLAVVGLAICIYELCDRSYALIVLFSHRHDITSTSRWVAVIAFEILGALLAVLGIIVFPIAILRAAQEVPQGSAASSLETPPPRHVENISVERTPETTLPPMKSPPLAPAPSPAPYGHDLHPAQLFTSPYAPPQPVLITGAPPPPGNNGFLQPAGYAYIAHPPNAHRDAIPIQPLTGQPILAGHPVYIPPYGTTPAPPPGPHQMMHPGMADANIPGHHRPQHLSPYDYNTVPPVPPRQ